ncbi:flagellar hook protein [Methylobacterium sp. E-065]|uniref:flagellin N-terminal helical domain-containing protein n=1 Tax=Methylobacterium sp. E-065 TaxID=2836583 RepID=UPI001FBBD556|nr:flagellin [Methylobacterium sp. E-065]MCJ2021831.1 flagellar hook protein [Methylobacterium sp. E-065]
MSSSVTLSAATRTNLLSLQGTADLLATTQNRLSTGKKVNSALDSPVNYFTSQALGSRSSDLSSLLDGISNGIQTIQAANQGITNLQKLTDQLKSTANQALSATNAFTAKAAVTSKALNGAVASNLLSTGATQALGTAIGASTGAAAQSATGSVTYTNDAAVATAVGATDKHFSVDGVNITIAGGTSDKATLLSTINAQLQAAGSSVVASYSTNALKFTGTSDGGSFAVPSGTDATALFGTNTAVAGTFVPTASSKATGLGFVNGDTFTVNGSTVSVNESDTIGTLAQKVASATNGDVTAQFNATTRQFTFTAKDANTAVNLGNGSTATALVSNIGYSTTQFAAGLGANGSVADLSGKVLQVTVGTGASAKTAALTFGSGAGQISTLDQLNTALGSADAQATIDSTGHLTITSSNDAGSQNLLLGGSAVGGSSAFLSSSSVATIGGDGQNARNKLVNDYNGLLTQINQMSKDSGYNGVNLLNGDQMKVAFNADNTSSIAVKGVATTADSLGLNTVSSSDFIDNDSINKVFSQISSATNTLKSQAATFSSNLSVVQNRQDFTKGIINVLDTGSANLVNADMNEEAANSQALSTRNSLGISALSLANTAQQGVLQLLR